MTLLLAGWGLLASPALAADTWTEVAPGIDRLYRTASGPLQIHAVQVDLGRDEISLRATMEGESPATTGAWASAVDATVAINGDWFDGSYDPVGVSVGDGWLWGIDEDPDTHCFIACNVTNECTIDPAHTATAWSPRWWNVVGGNNARLVVDGVAQSASEAFYSTDKHPRSAVGLSEDGETMWLVVVDGRSSSSVGITWNDMAVLMADLGAWQALMLDGGGSSTLIVQGSAVNTPSDGSQRTVANHLGVRWRDTVDAGCEGIPNGKYCLDDTQLATCAGGEYESGDCGYYGLTCEEDGDFAYCVDPRCTNGGQANVCVDDTVVGQCTDGVYAEGDCAYYGLQCVTGFDTAWCASSFYQGVYAGSSLDPDGDGIIEVPAGETLSGSVSFTNTGLSTWSPDTTRLAPLPRDTAHVLATDDWIAAHRITGVDAAVAPGETGTFTFDLAAPEDEALSLSLALVEEGLTWFADAPTGGGPAEGDLVFSVVLEGSGTGEGSGGEGGGSSGSDGGSDGGGSDGGDAGRGSRTGPDDGGCSAVSGATGLGALGLFLLLGRHRD